MQSTNFVNLNQLIKEDNIDQQNNTDIKLRTPFTTMIAIKLLKYTIGNIEWKKDKMVRHNNRAWWGRSQMLSKVETVANHIPKKVGLQNDNGCFLESGGDYLHALLVGLWIALYLCLDTLIKIKTRVFFLAVEGMTNITYTNHGLHLTLP